MKCPHCLVEFHPVQTEFRVGKDIDGEWLIWRFNCPSCSRIILFLAKRHLDDTFQTVSEGTLIYPRGTSRPPLPSEVPEELAKDYKEACLVLPDSPEASAALSRRCLQNLLREYAGVIPRDLYSEIEEVLPKLPSHVAEVLHMVRKIGNFGAHPNKSEKTGEILPVEPHEAEWNVEALEELFDFYFVQPKRIEARKEIISKKEKEAGRNKSE